MMRRRAVLCALVSAVAACSDDAVLQLFPSTSCAEGECGDASVEAGGERSDARRTDDSACPPLADRVQVSYPVLPAPAVPSDEYHPMLLAARADGTSLLGYKEAGATRVRVLALDHDGERAEEVFQIEGEEAHALLAHDVGGALVYMREDPDIYSAEYCRGAETPSQPICGSMELVRFGDDGAVDMRATLTNKDNVATDDASFIYWFEHTARLVWAEDTYGVYYRSARNHPMATSDLVSTDTLRFIDANGNRLDKGWTFGCFYSWSVRLVYNGFWAAACHADIMPNAHRVVVFDGEGQRELTFLEGTAPVDRALGGLVPAQDGLWLSYLQRDAIGLELHLARLDATPALEDDRIVKEAQYIDSDYVFRTYLAAYGDDLLVGWKSNERLVIAVADLETGTIVQDPTVTAAPIDNMVDFVSYPNGDVGWAHATSSGTVSVTRVLACDD